MNYGRGLPIRLYDAAGTRALDRAAIEACGIPGFDLMQSAGQAVFALLHRRWPQARRVRVVCGRGNNGGDGFVVAALARRAGMQVDLRLVGDPRGIGGDAARARELARGTGLEARPWMDTSAACDVIVDALLGTGLDRPVAGTAAAAIRAMNASSAPVLAVDVPSGLDASTGASLGDTVRAAATLTFIGCKQGLLTGQGPAFAGDIEFDDLGVPMSCYAAVPSASWRVDYAALAGTFGRRSRAAHKGDFGHVLIVGGAPGFAGAARLAAEAAGRCGAGLVSVATHPATVASINAERAELMCHGVESPSRLQALAARADVLVVGPGLGQDEWGMRLFAAVRELPGPKVVDADALNLLAADPEMMEDCILTPHPGEAARLLGTTTAAINRDRFEAAAGIAARYGSNVVLKGAGTLITTVGKTRVTRVLSGGNPGMATGGMGDVLSGVAGALIAQAWPPFEAAVAAAALHAEAADRAAAAQGERGLLAGDLLRHLRRAINRS